MIVREKYLEKIRPYYKKQLIKVLTGQRRVGKSSILKLICDELKKLYPEAGIILIDKEKYEFDDIRNYKYLVNHVKSHSLKNQNFLFYRRSSGDY